MFLSEKFTIQRIQENLDLENFLEESQGEDLSMYRRLSLTMVELGAPAACSAHDHCHDARFTLP